MNAYFITVSNTTNYLIIKQLWNYQLSTIYLSHDV